MNNTSNVRAQTEVLNDYFVQNRDEDQPLISSLDIETATYGVEVVSHMGAVAGSVRDVVTMGKKISTTGRQVAKGLKGIQFVGLVDLPVSAFSVGTAIKDLVVADTHEEHVEGGLALAESVGDLMDSIATSVVVIAEAAGDASDFAWIPPVLVVATVLKAATIATHGYGIHKTGKFLEAMDSVLDEKSNAVEQFRGLMQFLSCQSPLDLEQQFGVVNGALLRDIAGNCVAMLTGAETETLPTEEIDKLVDTIKSLIAMAGTEEGRRMLEGVTDAHTDEGERVERTLQWIATRDLKDLEKHFRVKDGNHVRALAAEALSKLAVADKGTSEHLHATAHGRELVGTLKGRAKTKIFNHKLRIVAAIIGVVALGLLFVCQPLSLALFVGVAVLSLALCIKEHRETRKPLIDPNRPRGYVPDDTLGSTDADEMRQWKEDQAFRKRLESEPQPQKRVRFDLSPRAAGPSYSPDAA